MNINQLKDTNPCVKNCDTRTSKSSRVHNYTNYKITNDSFGVNSAAKKSELTTKYGTIKRLQGTIGKYLNNFKNIFGIKNKSKNADGIIKQAENGQLNNEKVKKATDIPNVTKNAKEIKFKGHPTEDSEIRVFAYDTWGEEGQTIRDDIRTRILINAGLEDSSLELKKLKPIVSDDKTKYTEIVKKLSALKPNQKSVYDNMLPTPDGKGIRCKTVLSGRNKVAIDFRLRKLEENGINTIIDLRSQGECSTLALDVVNERKMKYVNFPVEDKNWSIESIQQMVKFIEAINSDNYCMGCANGQARTDLAVAINYIFNPKSSANVPDLYYGTQSTTRVSIRDNISRILGVISKNKEIVLDMGYKSYEEFTGAVEKRYTNLLNKLK